MSAKKVLLDLLEDNARRVHQLLEDLPDTGLHWQHQPTANSIAVTIWHASRAFDVFMTRHIKNRPAAEERWFTGGWAEATGYDPRGIGVNGWGMLTGYSQAETAAIPPLSKNQLAGYFDAIRNWIETYLEETPEEALWAQAPGYEGRQTNYFWVKHPLFDLTRHVGEMLAIQTLWEAHQTTPGEASV